MAGQGYNVPVILPDLRKEESYRQVVDALEYLEAVSDDIFNRLRYRINENTDQLASLNNRILTAQAKIDKLRSSSTKATRVFASPKYPAPKQISDYHTIFHEVDPALHKVHKIKDPIESRLPDVTMEVLKAKSKPYPLRLRRDSSRQVRATTIEDLEQLEGLGSLPKNLPSVSSLLLFNTTENPYKKYVLRDPLEGAKTKTRDTVVEEESKLHEAPETIIHGEQLERGQKDSLMYVPLMPELPELDVPDMLPSLQYVASDMYYQGDAGASIAPSVASIMPELPNLADPGAPAVQGTPELPPPVEDGGAPPPPPPPAPPPPPGPIAAPPLPTVTEGAGDESSDEEGGSPPDLGDDAGDDRANLMEAIRNAGGASKAGLKSSKDRKLERKAKKEITESGGGGDLLGDLSAALGRRRKAMSGKEKENRKEKKEDHKLGGGSMLDNMSRMIPTLEGSTKEESDDGEGWTT